MSFSGKKFRRTGTENVEELVKAANANENIIRILQHTAPTFCFTQLDNSLLQMTLHTEDKLLTYTFKLGEDVEMERRDGQKVKVKYTLEGDNVLKQVIKQPDGKIAYFRREFGDKEAKMLVIANFEDYCILHYLRDRLTLQTITMEGTDVQAKIYYEIVE